ncbi:hypothetical protein QJ48_04640 [Paenibacillus sp. A3]|nr:hypothetical protein QJ48_04640 [Paenibacillus sp. A3]
MFTPKHGSWLNVIESFFAKMTKHVLRHIRVKSKEELKKRIGLYLQEATGVTPHQYLIHLRIERSEQLIRCGNMSMKEIAAQVGFSDQAHFTKLFKRVTGLTPVKYASAL